MPAHKQVTLKIKKTQKTRLFLAQQENSGYK